MRYTVFFYLFLCSMCVAQNASCKPPCNYNDDCYDPQSVIGSPPSDMLCNCDYCNPINDCYSPTMKEPCHLMLSGEYVYQRCLCSQELKNDGDLCTATGPVSSNDFCELPPTCVSGNCVTGLPDPSKDGDICSDIVSSNEFCKLRPTCVNGDCVTGLPDPSKNGDSCTGPSPDFCGLPPTCLDGDCINLPNPTQNGQQCYDVDNNCDQGFCINGDCTHSNAPDGAICETNSNLCTKNICLDNYCITQDIPNCCHDDHDCPFYNNGCIAGNCENNQCIPETQSHLCCQANDHSECTPPEDIYCLDWECDESLYQGSYQGNNTLGECHYVQNLLCRYCGFPLNFVGHKEFVNTHSCTHHLSWHPPSDSETCGLEHFVITSSDDIGWEELIIDYDSIKNPDGLYTYITPPQPCYPEVHNYQIQSINNHGGHPAKSLASITFLTPDEL